MRGVAILAASALAACASESNPACGESPKANGAAMPLVHVGPDVDVDVVCNTGTEVPIASLSTQAGPPIFWQVTKMGADNISITAASRGVLCPGFSGTVVNATVGAPEAAVPGDTFEATFTFSAQDGEFPTATVTVRVRVVRPEFSIEPAVLDFGDVPELEDRNAVITIRNTTANNLSLSIQRTPTLPFMVQPILLDVRSLGSSAANVRFVGTSAGVYDDEAIWSTPTPDAGACTVSKSLQLHARVVARDAGAD
jgi:hypothetical protein